ncbi:LUD domain-containing protein [Streptomyces sp. NA04227]|uniref:LutC/YkgG family protein n=1 Tax=Streptomyces sp. NA04227 TaxID=2742136 RepID=UPI00159114C8|nr:LUD domain-containing protein [Streptomyces sp. NA04227]QKW11292.1 LUD domain-containing protein [Streptomyces sp. NA04227]
MSAREEILAGVRSALSGVPAPPPVPRGYRRVPTGTDLVDLFVERVEEYRARTVRCTSDGVERELVRVLPPGARVVVPDGFPWQVPGAVPGRALDPRALDSLDAVVTTATVAVAETGTLVLTHGPGQGRRALSLIPDLHVCVVRGQQLVADVPAAFALLDPADPTTWISGPSATSDIELERVEGVHGPRGLHVLVVTDA